MKDERNFGEIIDVFKDVNFTQKQIIIFVLKNHPRFEKATCSDVEGLFNKYGVSVFEEMYTNAVIYSRACAGVEELRKSLAQAEERRKELYTYYVGNIRH